MGFFKVLVSVSVVQAALISPAGPLQVCNCHDGVYIVVDKAAIHTMH